MTLLFCVQDAGIGIPVDKHDAIFEPFLQVDGALTRNFGGAGMRTLTGSVSFGKTLDATSPSIPAGSVAPPPTPYNWMMRLP
jgi:K+-sensing histidine kinase KdpD